MKVVCPFSDLNEATEFALKVEYWREATFVDVSAEGSYLELMRECWKAQETFVVVEHDIVPWPGALRQLDECSEPLCAYQYPMGVLNYGELMMGVGGCTKYGRDYIQRWPEALAEDLDWRDIMEHLLLAQAERPHIHTPAVLHLSPERFKRPVTSMHHGLPGAWPDFQANYPPTKTRTGRKPGLWL